MKAGLQVKPQKCEFHTNNVEYLGFIITTEGLQMDPAKITTIIEWPIPKKLRDVPSFLGFRNFYRRFIQDYSHLARPLTQLTKKGTAFVWLDLCQAAFERLKEAFTTAPILIHFDFDKKMVVETDGSDIASAGILSQPGSDRLLHPIAFFSKKLTPAECNYNIYDKELMAVVRAFEECRAYLVGRPVTVRSDHQNLRYFTTKRLLNQQQAQWSEFLSQFNYTIEFVPGKAHGKADELTRMAGQTEEGVLEDEKHRTQVVLKSQSLGLLADIPLHFGASPLNELWTEAYQADPLPNQILTMLEQGIRHSRLISLAECSKDGNRLRYRDGLYVPAHKPLKLAIIRENHDAPAAGHPGRSKTHELITRRYHWPSMRKEIARYVANCHICQRSRTTRHAPFGILRLLSIPYQPW